MKFPVFAALCAACLFVPTAQAVEVAPVLESVRVGNAEGAWILRARNLSGSPHLNAVYFSGNKVSAAYPVRYVQGNDGSWDVTLSGLDRATGTFQLERFREERAADGSLALASEGRSAAIAFRRSETLRVMEGLSEYRNTSSLVALRLNARLADRFGYDTLGKRDYRIVINGAEHLLTPYAGDAVYALGKFYFDGEFVFFLRSNLDRQDNHVAIKADGLVSNGIVLSNRTLTVGKLSRYEVEEDGSSTRIRLFFPVPGLGGIDGKTFYLNGAAVDARNVASPSRDAVSIVADLRAAGFSGWPWDVYVRDSVTQGWSNRSFFDLAEKFRFAVVGAKITGSGPSRTLEVSVHPDMAKGDLSGFSVVVGGRSFDTKGRQVQRKNVDGDLLRDMSGAPLTDTVDAILWRRTGGVFTAVLPADALTGDAVQLVFKSGHYGMETPAVKLARSADGSYNFAPAAAAGASAASPSASFVPVSPLAKSMDYVSDFVTEWPLGAVQVSNVASLSGYALRAKVSAPGAGPYVESLRIGPWLMMPDASGNSFSFEREFRGSELSPVLPWTVRFSALDVPPAPLTFSLVTFEITPIGPDGAVGAAVRTTGASSLSWRLAETGCFDGKTDACAAFGDATVTLAVAPGSAPAAVSVPVAQVSQKPAEPQASPLAVSAAEEPALSRPQRRQSFVLSSALSNAVIRLSKDNQARAKTTGLGLAAAIETRLSQVVDLGRRALLRQVAANLREKFK